ncbi:MAG: hypothetical protein P8J74_00520 [Woeseiaceae bacterium]|nr:hypothetical protein [Woeseiaceae bacterium]
MKCFYLLISLFISIFAVIGCGQSGALYVPGNPSQITVLPSLETNAMEGSDGVEDNSETNEQK